MPDQSIACTLTSEQKRERMSLIAGLAAEALVGHEPIDGGMRARFRNAPGIEQRVRDLAAAEAQCCASLRFEVHHHAAPCCSTSPAPPRPNPQSAPCSRCSWLTLRVCSARGSAYGVG